MHAWGLLPEAPYGVVMEGMMIGWVLVGILAGWLGVNTALLAVAVLTSWT